MPDLDIPDGLFLPEAGSSNMTDPLMAQGDWFLTFSLESIFPLPAGWTTDEGEQGTDILFSANGNLDEPSIVIRLRFSGYAGDDRTVEEVMVEYELSLNEDPTASILKRAIVDPSKGYIFLTWITDSDRKENVLVLFSEDVSGFFHRFVVRTGPEDWDDYYPIVRAIVDHWADWEYRPLGIALPDDLSE